MATEVRARGRAVAPAGSLRARPWLLPIAFAALLVAYNNLLFGLPGDLSFPRSWVFYPRAVLIPLAALAWAVKSQAFALSDLGITRRGLLRSVAVGFGAAALVAVPAAVYFLFPVGVSEGSIDYQRSTHDSAGAFLFWAGVRYPLNSAIFEEVLFRGVLLALAVRALGVGRGAVLSAAAFALWHIVVNHVTMDHSNVADSAALFAFAQVGALVALFVGGLALAWMRLRYGSLAGPVVFHWAAVVAMNAVLYAQNQ